MSHVSAECLEFTFGPFRLIPERQLLVEGEKPVNLGARGLELLRALVEHSGEVVSKDELIARIWPDTPGRCRRVNRGGYRERCAGAPCDRHQPRTAPRKWRNGAAP
jgi:DNA-binding response OmpR family regulator